MHPKLIEITNRIADRSAASRSAYEERMQQAIAQGPRRAHLSCGNQAHAYAAMGTDKDALAAERQPNIGIITAYNDMLSAHQPFQTYPDLIKQTAQAQGATAQVAGGVPAMCDGVTQGQTGMELSLFSRDVIALAASIGLSHNTFDAAIYLGMCDKINPGLIMAAGTFGFMPAIFLPAGPMTSGISNDEKARVRNEFAQGKLDRAALMKSEMASYHGPGTCTFYGTANSNQMLMEFMGLHIPSATFVNPNTPLRDALTTYGTQQVLSITALGDQFIPAYKILSVKAFVNGIVGLMATGGSTNLILHLPAMAAASGITLTLEDFDDIAQIVPLMAKVYPNGLADVNHFHAAGGLNYMIKELRENGLLHDDVMTVMGHGLDAYCTEAGLENDELVFRPCADVPENDKILRPVSNPFQPTGGLKNLSGNIGAAMIKLSSVAEDKRTVEAPARVFHDQHSVKAAFQAGEFTGDCVIVVRYQGPKANGMPELHALTPVLSVLQDRGYRVALVTDGRMSGASGKVPSAIHVTPEAMDGGAIAKIRDGDIIRLDALSGTLENLTQGFLDRPAAQADLSDNQFGIGRELFDLFRQNASRATLGASAILKG